ncbi:MAG: LysR substrate-binding domain-containing protein, partial [Chitinophagaceae bacterium]
NHLIFRTGSVETLKRMVDLNKGVTIIPELSIQNFSEEQLEMIRYFKDPEPAREISIVTQRHFIKSALMDALKNEILKVVPENMKTNHQKTIVSIH